MKNRKLMKRLTILLFAFIVIVVCINLINYNKFFESKKNIMFILHTETFGGKGVYDIYKEMKKVGHNVKIAAIPNIYSGVLVNKIATEFIDKFDQIDVIYPCGKTEPYTQCSPIKSDKFDYIFVQNPYNTYTNSILDPYYTHESLRKHTKKLAYIVYGPHLFHQHQINDINLPNLVDTVFVDSESTKEIYKQYYNLPKDRIVVSGYESYKLVRDLKNNCKKSKQETILWMPRWLLSFKYRDLFEGGSTFLNYHYFFYNYAKNNPHINFIIRPHSFLFFQAQADYFSQEDLDTIFNKFKSLGNVTISMHAERSLVDDVLAADVVISDGTSALGEVVVADKPIIYLSNGWNNEFNSNKLSRALKKYIYLAYDPSDIKEFLQKIRDSNYIAFEEKNCAGLRCKLKSIKCTIFKDICSREEFKKNLDPVDNPAKFIADYLLHQNL